MLQTLTSSEGHVTCFTLNGSKYGPISHRHIAWRLVDTKTIDYQGFILRNFLCLVSERMWQCVYVRVFMEIPKPVTLYTRKLVFVEKLNGNKIGSEFTSVVKLTGGNFFGQSTQGGGENYQGGYFTRWCHTHWWRQYMIHNNYCNSDCNSS